MEDPPAACVRHEVLALVVADNHYALSVPDAGDTAHAAPGRLLEGGGIVALDVDALARYILAARGMELEMDPDRLVTSPTRRGRRRLSTSHDIGDTVKKNTFSRREFLGTSAAAAGGSLVAGKVVSL